MTFTVVQHEASIIEDAITALTGKPARAGTTYLTFMATLTAVESAGMTFHVHGGGDIEFMVIPCPSCGVAQGSKWVTRKEAVARGAQIVALPKEGLLRRLVYRATNSCPCGKI